MKVIQDLKFHWLLLLLGCGAFLHVIHQPDVWSILIFILMIIRLIKSRKRPLILIYIILMSLMGISCYRHQLGINHQQGLFEVGKEETLKVFLDPLRIKMGEEGYSGFAWVEVEDQKFEIFYRGVLTDETRDLLEQGQGACYWLEAQGKMEYPPAARNFHTFDYREYLKRQSIVWSFQINHIDQLKIVEGEGLASLWMGWINLKAKLYSRLRQGDQGVLIAIRNKLFFNLESSTWSQVKEVFALLGILHYFAISGFHMDFIRNHLDYLMRRSGLEIGIGQWLVSIILVIYASFISWPIGVIRSLAVHFGHQAIQRFHWPISRVDLLAIVGLILLIYHPLYLYNIGFILSFLISFIIIFYQQSVKEGVSNHQQRLELTLICLLFTWPIILPLSHEWNLLQFVVLICFSYIFDRYVLKGFLLLTALTIASSFLPFLDEFINDLSLMFEFVWGKTFIQPLMQSFSYVHGHPASWQILALLSGGIIFLYYLRKCPKRAGTFVLTIYFMVFFLSPFLTLSQKVTVLDVGQGDALLYQEAFNQGAWLIDTGGRSNWKNGEIVDQAYADKNLLPALKSLGVRSLSGVIITHPDSDHMGNLTRLIDTVAIQNIYLTSYTQDSDSWQKLAPKIHPQTKIHLLEENQELPLLGGRLNLMTLSFASGDQDISNNSSIISLLQLGPYRLLNMGDLNSDQEKALITKYPKLKTDFLKLGHHGSRSSTSLSFLKRLEVKYGLISAGENNRYGHPHPEVLERLENLGIPNYQTNLQGALQIEWHPFWGLKLQTALKAGS